MGRGGWDSGEEKGPKHDNLCAHQSTAHPIGKSTSEKKDYYADGGKGGLKKKGEGDRVTLKGVSGQAVLG